ncbi:hypothetical protein L9F63_024710 [Diploptera punctata]|uniref:Uncharacterized protein n=1 Tax=Diploptera punctata TaxID=6984 RepID=A0AAD7ZEG8_DIPPU|nr:hypothetical protein L9F63_024710 [Diploptera punctata]
MSINFEIICRLCMNNCSTMISLFDDTCVLPEKIMKLIPAVKIYLGDNLPTHVCLECEKQVNSFSEFRMQCESSNLALNKYLQRQESEKVIEEKCEDLLSSDITSDVHFLNDETDQREKCWNICSNGEKIENRFFPDLREESVLQECNDKLRLEPEIECSLLNKNKFRDKFGNKLSNVTKTKKLSVKLKDTNILCTICGKLVVQRRLNEHIRRHVGGRPFKCDECGKTFTERNNLKKHSLVHSGLKVHMCDICGKRFKLLNHLKAHHLTHTGQKLHVCDVCGKRFSQIGNFKKHELLHTGERPFGCDICGKSYSQKNTLQIHLAVHTGQRQHVCEICGKGFIVKGHLRTHLVVHSGEKKFSCEICGLSYTQRHSLKKHKAKHLIS